jgi:exodeoxyribonuclease V gamma subunit
MGEGRFPARELDTGLDLRALGRKPGDVSIDERDRYTFLETLLSTRERLVLSFVARDPQTGETREPSSIIHALEEAIGHPLPRVSPPMRRHEMAASGSNGDLDPIRVHALPAAVRDASARLAGAEHRPLLVDARFPEGALRNLSADDPRRALLAMPILPLPSLGPDTQRRISIDAIRRFLECPIQGHARLAIGDGREPSDMAREDEPFEVERFIRERVLIEVFLESLDHADRELRSIYERCIAWSAAHGQWPIGPLAKLRAEDDARVLETWRSVLGGERARFERGTNVHVWRFGSNAEGVGAKATRPHEALRVAMTPERDESSDSIEIVGATRWLLPNEEGLLLSTSNALEGEGERARVERLKHALRVFVDHAVLSAAGLVQGGRRVWVLDQSADGPLVMQFAPMKKEAALRWLRGVLGDLSDGPHGLFLPCDAVFRESRLFTHGSDEPSEHLARSIEHVRTKEPWQGGSSRFGPVRDAIEYPAPEKAHALAIAGRRFGAFFDHFRGARRAS